MEFSREKNFASQNLSIHLLQLSKFMVYWPNVQCNMTIRSCIRLQLRKRTLKSVKKNCWSREYQNWEFLEDIWVQNGQSDTFKIFMMFLKRKGNFGFYLFYLTKLINPLLCLRICTLFRMQLFKIGIKPMKIKLCNVYNFVLTNTCSSLCLKIAEFWNLV